MVSLWKLKKRWCLKQKWKFSALWDQRDIPDLEEEATPQSPAQSPGAERHGSLRQWVLGHEEQGQAPGGAATLRAPFKTQTLVLWYVATHSRFQNFRVKCPDRLKQFT